MMIYTDRKIAGVLMRKHRLNADMLKDKVARDPQCRAICEEKIRLLEEVARELGIDILNPGAYAAQQQKKAAPVRKGRQKERAGTDVYYITA